MMAPRTLVSGSIFTNVKPTLDQMVSDLQSEVRRLQAQLVDEQRRRSMAEANAARLQRARNKPRVIPIGDMDDGYECPNMGCSVALSEDYDFCPGCGCEIDWRTSAEPDYMYDSLRDLRVDENLAYDLAGDR